ncbi:TetR/AcrR family transcriptional regulator [Bacillus sp. APMAM]|nr:TetR/AcrR family transcriptional regulator [Bacillus sp. APMAM]RTZ53179.1 TetR/AcrR family transcriptional regulator [Bacillus sp. SAJ1]
MPKVSESYKEKKRLLIMENALILFGEKGYELTTIDDIGLKSGISKGMVYTYFKSKEDLYITSMQQRTNHTFSKLQERFKKFSSAEEKIVELLRVYREAVTTTEGWTNIIRVDLEFWINSSRYDHLRNIMKEHFKNQMLHFLIQIIQEGQKNGEFKREVETETFASLFWAMLDGICLHYAVIDKEYDYRGNFLLAEKMILQYLK